MKNFDEFCDFFEREINKQITTKKDDLDTMLKALPEKLDSQKSIKDFILELYLTLSESELKLQKYIYYIEGKPVSGADILKMKGRMEYGLILYWIQNPPEEVQKYLSNHRSLQKFWKVLSVGLKWLGLKPQITTSQYKALMNKIASPGVVAPDGTILGWEKYEQYDLNWLVTPPYWLWNKMFPSAVHSFGTNAPFNKSTLASKSGSTNITIGILGDWGTGEWDDHNQAAPAVDVMATMKKITPSLDYAIHLGDVYYAGTEDRIPANEEMENFLDLWDDFDKGNCFTLNSNHEMYGAAQGYFDVALKASGPFAHQNQKSYFALSNKDWVIIGLDSAYYTKTGLYMNGNLSGGTSTEQADFIGNLDTAGKKVIILTHHNPIELDGNSLIKDKSNPVCLFNEVKNALGRDPDYWYWGHAHNGIAYNTRSAAGPNTVGRCVGHAAIPFGAAWGLNGNSAIDYSANTPNPIVPGIRVMNGFLVITLTGDTLSDAFYDQDKPSPVWP